MAAGLARVTLARFEAANEPALTTRVAREQRDASGALQHWMRLKNVGHLTLSFGTRIPNAEDGGYVYSPRYAATSSCVQA